MNQEITLEMVDEVLRRKQVSYSEAKRALEASNGDILGALAILDDKKTTTGHSLWDQLKAWIAELNKTKVSFVKHDTEFVTLPGTIALILLIACLPLSIVILLGSIFFGYKLKITKLGQPVAFQKEIDKVQDNIETIGK
ncbi:DUF4342 domain-containing protein [Guggenheimella bovis]